MPEITEKNTAARRAASVIMLSLGIMGTAFGAIFARAADAHALVKSAYRLLFAAAAMMPFALIWYRVELAQLTRRDWLTLAGSGFFLAAHFGTWITSLDYTTVASSVVLVDSLPIWTALLNMAIGNGAPTRRGWLCIVMSIAGAAIVSFGDMAFSGEALIGDALALAGAIALSANIIMGKALRAKLSATSYCAASYGFAALFMWVLVLVMGLEVTGFSAKTWGAFAGMAFVSQIIGHSAFNWALGSFSSGFVAVARMGEPVGSSIMAYLFFAEVPGALSFAGIVMIMAAIFLAAREG